MTKRNADPTPLWQPRRPLGAVAAAAVLLAAGGALAQEEAPPPAPPEEEAPAAAPEGAMPAEPAPTAEAAPPGAEGNPGEMLPDGTYVIKTGDTLWDLSQQFLANPWYWPKIWADNPYIENPHWIYPTNKLKIRQPAEGMPAEVAAGPEEAPPDGAGDEPEPLPPVGPAEIADFTTGSLHSIDNLGQDSDLVSVSGERRLGFVPRDRLSVVVTSVITPNELSESGRIVASFEEKALLANQDQAYLRFADLGKVKVGESYTVFRPGTPVVHPISHAGYGYLSELVGSVKIVGKEGELAVGVIEGAVDYIQRNDLVGPAVVMEKNVSPRAPAQDVTGYILATLVPRQTHIGETHVVFLDKGAKDGVAEGNVFQVVHWGDGLRPVLAASQGSGVQGQTSLPREVVATLLVFDVAPETSTAMVVKSVREVTVGDYIEMRTGRAGAGGDAR